MQLSAPSSSSEIAPAASAPTGAAADLAALASTAAGADGDHSRGAFAILFPDLSPAAAAAANPAATLLPTAAAEKSSGSPKLGAAAWAGGPRRPGFPFARPSSRPAEKAGDAVDPQTLLALAGVLPTTPPPADSALPTLELPGEPLTNLPSGQGETSALGSNPAMGKESAARAATDSGSAAAGSGLTDLAALAANPSAAANPPEAGFGFPDASDSKPGEPNLPAPSGIGGRPPAPTDLAGLTSGQGAKIAETGARFERDGGARERGADKKILSALDKRVAEPRPDLGTDVAKPAPAMANSSILRPPSPDSTSGAVTGVAAAQHDRLPPAADSAAVTASQAHRAVEAVLSAADRVGAGEKQAVNLQFSFLDVSLAVRVELREGAVHTTFRTDSAELRSALAHEWQSVSSQVSDRPIKMADPVFAANHGGSGSLAGDSARQQQQQQQSQQQHLQRDSHARAGRDFLSSATAARPAAPHTSAASPADGAAPAGRGRRPTTNHLETFA
jgi:hypothetical protein